MAGVDDLTALWAELYGRDAPEKIICVALNSHDQAAEQGAELPADPRVFGKFPNALSGPGDAIVLPPESSHVDAEAELAVVIGAEGRRGGDGGAPPVRARDT